MTCIAALDANVATLDLYEQLCSDAGYETILCPDATTAYECIREAEPNAIILDLRLSADDAGWAVLRSLKEDAWLSETPVIVCTADVRIVQQCADELQSLGCVVLAKPFDIDALWTALSEKIEATCVLTRPWMLGAGLISFISRPSSTYNVRARWPGRLSPRATASSSAIPALRRSRPHRVRWPMQSLFLCDAPPLDTQRRDGS
jgi:CheY-like chemotaxis protein